MTATSSMVFSTMEPQLDDTMEIGSPYNGPTDDFEIDLDTMQDQVSNPDNDVMVADAFPEISNDSVQDAVNDADMVDDAAEPATMIGAYEQIPETDNSTDKYQVEESLETEMEDEYEEDIDAPVSGYEEQTSANTDIKRNGEVGEIHFTETAEVVEDETDTLVTEQPNETQGSQIHESAAGESHLPPAQPHDNEEGNIAAESGEHKDQGEHDDNTNKTETVDSQPARAVDGVDMTHLNEHEEETHKAVEQISQVNEIQPQKTEPEEIKSEFEPSKRETGLVQTPQPLHPVKVFYQDNEISLFPPQEGDFSETFFLEDENLAYEDFGMLLKACREVLGEHLGEHEVLVADIDSINIQLLEDSIHTSKLSMRQLLDVYLHLSHNEGIDVPEPLYMTLYTKSTVPAQISDLVAAANDGRGLSEVLSWDEFGEKPEEDAQDEKQEGYHEVPPSGSEDSHQREIGQNEEVSDDKEAVHHTEDPSGNEDSPQKEIGQNEEVSDDKEAVHHTEDPSGNEDSPQKEIGQNEEVSDDKEPAHHAEDSGGDHDARFELNEENGRSDYSPADGDAEGKHAEAQEETDASKRRLGDHPKRVEGGKGTHDKLPSEETAFNPVQQKEQNTDSTSTLSNSPPSQLTDEQRRTTPAESSAVDDHVINDHVDQVEGAVDTSDPEGETGQDVPEPGDFPEESQQRVEANVGHGAVEQNTENHEGNSSSKHEQEHTEEATSTVAPGDAVDEQYPLEPQEGENDNASQRASRETPDAADDLLGANDELLNNPVKAAEPTSTVTAKEVTDDLEDDLDDGEIREEVGSLPADDGEALQVGHGFGEQSEDGEIPNKSEPTTHAKPSEDNAQEPSSGNNDRIDLGIMETVGDTMEPSNGLSPDKQDNVSTKRTREEEDESEVAEAPTPDLKRSRSS